MTPLELVEALATKGVRLYEVTPEMVRAILDRPPYWIAGSYLRSYREGRGTAEALAYAVTSALKIAGHNVSAYDDGDVDAVLEIIVGMGYGERSVAATWA